MNGQFGRYIETYHVLKVILPLDESRSLDW